MQSMSYNVGPCQNPTTCNIYRPQGRVQNTLPILKIKRRKKRSAGVLGSYKDGSMYLAYLDRQVANNTRDIGLVVSQYGLRVNDRGAFVARSVFVADAVMMEARRSRRLHGMHRVLWMFTKGCCRSCHTEHCVTGISNTTVIVFTIFTTALRPFLHPSYLTARLS